MGKNLSRRRFLAAAGIAGVATAGYGFVASRDLRVNRQTLHLERWDAEGFKVVQISDVHVNDANQTRTAREAVRLALAEKPDLIVFTGDFVNYSAEECLANIPLAFEELSDAKCPCLAVFGNHDYWCGAIDKVAEKVRQTRLRLLVNEVVDVQGVAVTGLDDGLSGSPDWKLPPKTGSSLVLLHEPDFVKALPYHASLMLAGHSHGGEICLPGGLPLYTPTGSKVYKSGFYDRKTVPLFVSHGTATLGPGRCFCPAEINVLTLRGL